jgi:hypothetical protein
MRQWCLRLNPLHIQNMEETSNWRMDMCTHLFPDEVILVAFLLPGKFSNKRCKNHRSFFLMKAKFIQENHNKSEVFFSPRAFRQHGQGVKGYVLTNNDR